MSETTPESTPVEETTVEPAAAPEESATPVADSVAATPVEEPAADEEPIPVGDSTDEDVPLQAGSAEEDRPVVGKRAFVGPIVPATSDVALGEPAGKQLYTAVVNAKQPGDDGYDAHSDPLIASSAQAETIMTEIKGFGHSPMWKAIKQRFHEIWDEVFAQGKEEAERVVEDEEAEGAAVLAQVKADINKDTTS